jgi:hypothetical protein
MLEVLALLGMRSSPSLEVMLAAAVDISSKYLALQEQQQQEQQPYGADLPGQLALLQKRGRTLLRLLDQLPPSPSSSSAAAWSQLASLCWCPVSSQPPEPGLPWPTATTSGLVRTLALPPPFPSPPPP